MVTHGTVGKNANGVKRAVVAETPEHQRSGALLIAAVGFVAAVVVLAFGIAAPDMAATDSGGIGIIPRLLAALFVLIGTAAGAFAIAYGMSGVRSSDR